MLYLLIPKLYKIILNTCSFMGLYFHLGLCLFMFHQCIIFHGVNIHNLSIYSFVSGHMNSAIFSINVIKYFNCIFAWNLFSFLSKNDNVGTLNLLFSRYRYWHCLRTNPKFFWKYFSYQLIFGQSLIPHICATEKDQE